MAADTPVFDWFLPATFHAETAASERRRGSRRIRRPHGRERVAEFAETHGLRAAPPMTDGMQLKVRLTTKRRGGGGGGGRPPKLTPYDRGFWDQSWQTIMSEAEAGTRRLTLKNLREGAFPPVMTDWGLASALSKGNPNRQTRARRVDDFFRHFAWVASVDPGGNVLWRSGAATKVDDVRPFLEAAARADINCPMAWGPDQWAHIADDASSRESWQISAADARDYKKTRQSARVEEKWRKETHVDTVFEELKGASLRTVRTTSR